MAGEWLEAPQGSVGNTPDLRNPLGSMQFITPADQIALAKASGFVPGTTSLLPTMTDLTTVGTSLLDNAYKQQLAYKQAQANLDEAVARTGYYGAQSDNIQSESDLRKQTMPFVVQQDALKLKSDQSNFDLAKAQQADLADAQDRAKEAMTSLPRYDDPDYQNKINTWLNDNAHLLSRPDAVGKQLQTAYGLVDGRVKATSQFQQKLGQIQEFNQLQQGGYINSPANADSQVFGGTAEPTLVHGRMAKNLDQLQQLISDPRTPQAQREQLNNLYNYGNTFLGSDTGAADVMANKAKTLFDTNGNFNGTAKGIVNGVSAMLGKETKPAEYETTIPIPGVPGPKRGEQATETIKGTREQIQEALTPLEQAEQRKSQAQGVPDTPENNADKAAYQRGEIDFNELTRRVNARAVPAATPAPTPARTEFNPTPGTTQVIQPTENQVVDFGNTATYHGDGVVTGHVTNFGHDVNGKPDTYDFAKLGPSARYGAWGDDLFNPNLAAASIPTQTFRALIGNPSDPQIEQMIRNNQLAVQVSAPNGQTGTFPIKDLGPGRGVNASLDLTGAAWRQLGVNNNFNGTYRIIALPRGSQGAQASQPQQTLSNSSLPTPKSVAEAGALPPGTHFLDPDGNRRMVPGGAALRQVSYTPGGVESSVGEDQYGVQSQNAPKPKLVTTDPSTVDFGDYTFNVAGTFGRHYDGTVDTSESGKGFYNNPATGKPYDLRDSKLVGARIPMSDLEQVMGLDANDRKSPVSRDIASGEYQVQVATADGTVVQVPLVDVNTDPNARGLELTYAAIRLFQTRNARQLGYKLVNRNGETVTPTYGVKPSQIRGRQTFQSQV